MKRKRLRKLVESMPDVPLPIGLGVPRMTLVSNWMRRQFVFQCPGCGARIAVPARELRTEVMEHEAWCSVVDEIERAGAEVRS